MERKYEIIEFGNKELETKIKDCFFEYNAAEARRIDTDTEKYQYAEWNVWKGGEIIGKVTEEEDENSTEKNILIGNDGYSYKKIFE